MPKTIRFTDLTIRDGQQSLAATRMSTEQALRVLPMIDKAGYQSMELWGGVTPGEIPGYAGRISKDPGTPARAEPVRLPALSG